MIAYLKENPVLAIVLAVCLVVILLAAAAMIAGKKKQARQTPSESLREPEQPETSERPAVLPDPEDTAAPDEPMLSGNARQLTPEETDKEETNREETAVPEPETSPAPPRGGEETAFHPRCPRRFCGRQGGNT